MRYTIRRVSVGSALRLGITLGWLIMLCPAVCLAGVAVRLLQRLNEALSTVTPINLSVFGQNLAQIDILASLGLRATAGAVAALVRHVPLTFALLTLVLVVLGAALFVITTLIFSLGYNLLAALGGGLVIELARDGRPTRDQS